MDTLTHMAIGAVAGDLIAGNKYKKKAMLWGAVIASLPDIDVVAQPFLSSAQSLLFHRGPIHSILVCAILTPLIAKLLTRIHKTTNFRLWLCLVGWCLFSHLFTDCFNTYGTAILWPFSNVRVAFDSIGIIDLFFLLPLLLALIFFIFTHRNTRARKIIAIAALSCSALYLGFTISNKLTLENKIKTELVAKNIEYKRVLTAPLPLTNFVWLIVIETNDGFYLANYSRPEHQLFYSGYYRKNYYLAEKFANDSEFELLQRFSKGFYCLSQNANGEIFFYDLRFGSFDFDGTADLSQAVFVHQLTQNENGKLKLKHHSPRRKFNRAKLRRYFKQALDI